MIETRYEVRSQSGGRVGSFTDLAAAIASCRTTNVGRDDTTAYVVVSVFVPIPVGT